MFFILASSTWMEGWWLFLLKWQTAKLAREQNMINGNSKNTFLNKSIW